MFKKIASIALTATMVVGGAAISVSAAEADQSSEIGATAGSDAGASASSETGSGKVFHFDAKSAGWNNATENNVYCHLYRISDGVESSWQSKAEKATYNPSTGIATFDIATGLKKQPKLAEINENNEWCIQFSIKSANETYPILVNSNCYGDTIICPDKSVMYENNVDSEKKSVAVQWKKSGLGPAKTITSTGKIQGNDYAYGENANTTVASYLMSWALDTKKVNTENMQNIFNELNASVKDSYASFLDKENKDTKKTDDVKAQEKDAVVKVLATVKDPTTGKTYTVDELNGVKPNDGRTTGGSSNSGSGSGSSSGSGSGSSSVKSGQETTILFVFGGLMVAAAGVMFLARKKRQF